MSEQWHVEVREGESGSVLRYVFTELPITIGRHEGNDVRLPRPFVSGFHARIERTSAGLSVLDVSRTNGVRARVADGKEARIARERPQPLSSCEHQFAIGAYRIRVQAAAARLDAAESGSVSAGALSLPRLSQRWESLAAGQSGLPSLPAAAPAPPRVVPSLGTASERRALEAAALVELEELLRVFAPGQSLDTPQRVSQLVQRVRLSLELSCRGLVRLRQGQQRCSSALQLPRLGSGGELGAESSAQLLGQLFDDRLPLAELHVALQAEFQALARHQVALLDGMIEGAAALANELAPERIEARAARQRARHWLPLAGKLRALRRAYREQHAQLSRRDGALSVLFGRAFREAYAAYLAKARAHAQRGSARRRPELG